MDTIGAAMNELPTSPSGRGSHLKPPNRFDRITVEDDFEHLEFDPDALEDSRHIQTEYLVDDTKSIISTNDSPDISFNYSINPYRGCQHGCAYCYARPGHEYLGLNAGIDFESKIFVKLRAAELFREFLQKDSWKPEVIVFSGVTDCYQPAERRFQLTRQCLEVALEARQPVGIITKNALILRDLDLLREMAQRNLVRANLSITTLDTELARTMEPRTSSPAARLRAVRELRQAGVPVNVMTAPIIPGLNDSEIPALLQAAAEAGAQTAAYVLLRLPLTVEPVFNEWLARAQPSHRERIESRIRACRDGQMYQSQWRERQRGTGQIAEQIQNTFEVFRKKYQLNRPVPTLDFSQFTPPKPKSGQLRLF